MLRHFTEKAQRGAFIFPLLHEDIDHMAILVYAAPQITPFAPGTLTIVTSSIIQYRRVARVAYEGSALGRTAG